MLKLYLCVEVFVVSFHDVGSVQFSPSHLFSSPRCSNSRATSTAYVLSPFASAGSVSLLGLACWLRFGQQMRANIGVQLVRGGRESGEGERIVGVIIVGVVCHKICHSAHSMAKARLFHRGTCGCIRISPRFNSTKSRLRTTMQQNGCCVRSVRYLSLCGLTPKDHISGWSWMKREQHDH